jgi:flavin-dependent dehydrogenase
MTGGRPLDADVIVVGAGPAGAAASILLAEQGFHVLVLDRARFPRPKICGEYLSPEAGRVLDRLGVLKVVDAAAMPLRGMRITAPDGTELTGSYRSIGEWRPYRQHAVAVSRLALDAALADRLRALPVDFREEVRVTDVIVERGAVIGVEARSAGNERLTFRAPLTLAADGRTSVVAQRLGCRRPHRLSRMALVTYVTGVAAAGELGEIFVDPPDYAILNPVAEGRMNMSLVVPLGHAARYSDRLERFFDARVKQLPAVSRRLAGAERVEPVRAMGPLAYRAVAPHEGGALLIGDAAGFFDPFTGEGVFTALRSAELAVEVAAPGLRAGDVSARALAPYLRLRRDAFAAKERLTRVLQLVIRRRSLANVTAHVLARRPALLDTLMGVIGDFVPPRAVLAQLWRD